MNLLKEGIPHTQCQIISSRRQSLYQLKCGNMLVYFFNLQKAFDCLDHTVTALSEMLWKECLAVRGISLEWIISSLIPRTQKLCVPSIGRSLVTLTGKNLLQSHWGEYLLTMAILEQNVLDVIEPFTVLTRQDFYPSRISGQVLQGRVDMCAAVFHCVGPRVSPLSRDGREIAADIFVALTQDRLLQANL